MPIVELIPSKENREFTTGLGNWSAFDSWEPGPIDSHLGLAVTDLPSGLVEKNILLSYPACKPPPNEFIYLRFRYRILPVAPVFILLKTYLSDANYNFELPYVSHLDPDGWVHITHYKTLPIDWIKINSFIHLNWVKDSPLPKKVYHDDFSMTYTSLARTDHLPVMGVA